MKRSQLIVSRKLFAWKLGVIYEKVYASPRPPPKISLKHDWMKELGSEVVRRPEGEIAQQSKSSQSSQPDPNPDHDRTVKPVVCPQRGASRSQEIETRSFREEAVKHDRTEKPVACRDENHQHPTVVCSEQTTHPRFSHKGQNLILEEETNHDRTGKPVVCPQAGASQKRFSHDSTNFNVEDEKKHDRTVKPFVCRDANHDRSMLNEVDIDFRIPGLPHSVVKQAENYRVRELVKKIENHPHQQSLQRDLQQNKAYNPFSATSKKMIQDMVNVELFELYETDPETQCKECLSYWSEGIVYCTCGHLMKKSAANRGVIQQTLDLLSIPNYGPHGRRYGKTPQQKEYHQAHYLKKRCIKKGYQGIHDRFLIDSEFRASQLEHDRDEEVCIKLDELADKNFSHYMTQAEYFRYKQNWWISLNKSGNTGPLRNRSDFNEVLSTLHRLHQESGERQLRPMPFWKYQQWHQSSSSSSSWCQWSDSWWSSQEFKVSR